MVGHGKLIERLVPAVRAAGEAIMAIYRGDFTVRAKADKSPVTEADERAEALIEAALGDLLPGVPVVAEEAVAKGGSPAVGARFWLVDPLDGTREFVGRNGEFTVNVALVEDARPVLGVVLAPALGRLFGGVHGDGAFVEERGSRRTIGVRAVPAEGLTVLASRSHRDDAALGEFLMGRHVATVRAAGSSLKFCLIAAGEADLYPRLGRTMEWDTAAGHAVLGAAGGRLTDLDGAPLAYGKPGFANPPFVAWGDGC